MSNEKVADFPTDLCKCRQCRVGKGCRRRIIILTQEHIIIIVNIPLIKYINAMRKGAVVFYALRKLYYLILIDHVGETAMISRRVGQNYESVSHDNKV